MKVAVARRCVRYFQVALSLGLLSCGVVHAASFTVNSTADATDSYPGNGICETATSNATCTLRAAIQEANATSGSSSITLPAGTYTLTLTGAKEDNAATGDLDIQNTISILGAGRSNTIIDGNNTDRVFHVVSGVLSANALTIRNGKRNGSSTDAEMVGGAIYVLYGSLGLSDVVVRDSYAELDGGAIYAVDDTITVVNSLLENNSAGSRGGAVAIYSSDGAYGATLGIQDTTIKANTSTMGGGIYCARATISATGIRMQANIASGGASAGGGVNGYQCTAGFTQSTFDLNRATVKGGAVSLISSTATFVSSTLSGNGNGNMDRRGGFGGAIYGTSSTVNVYGSTIANNISATGPAIYTEVVSTINLSNSIIAGNLGFWSFPSEIYGALASSGHNLIQLHRSLSAATSDTGNATDIVGQDPLLGPLADNGGATPTHALLPGSPAIDGGDPTGCKYDAIAITQDQRAMSRTLAGTSGGTARCDIGAYEYAYAPGFAISRLSGLITTEPGATDTFQVRLNQAPSASVTLPLSSTNTAEATVAPAQLVFDSGNWNTWQTVTLHGVDDASADGSVAYSVITGAATSADAAFNGVDPSDVSASNYDDENAAITITPATTLVTTEGDWSVSLNVIMASPPTSDVSVRFNISDFTEGTFLMPGGLNIPQPDGSVSDGSYTTLVFTPDNWFIPNSLSIYPVSDSTVDGDITYPINIVVTSADPAYSNKAVVSVNMTNVNIDTANTSGGSGGAGGGGGGGGCAMASGSQPDPLLPMLCAVAALGLWRRNRALPKS